MEPSEFVTRWESLLARTTGQEAARPLVRVAAAPPGAGPFPPPPLPPDAARFLSEAGLPREWSGAFDFDFDQILEPVGDVYGSRGRPSDWESPVVHARLNAYRYLGYDGGNNPLCLDTADDDGSGGGGHRVVFLIYARGFDRGEFVNAGVAQLAGCILAFEEALEAHQEAHGGEELEWWATGFPGPLAERLTAQIGRIDPEALARGERGYWPALLLQSGK